ncbi:hypothetical protein TNIN_471091 [Trichonephila inaurata madagascariensis]|uniref:Uncharacterized protein n=1 Tax=Trichonephila inaurata madagascariensis TaxID=2747483 RepID=A0A8X6YMU8_9ARAC|nr:hypothetical protein TNIN_471091 [Trichonephila inaurata madagascariensis]
MKFHTTLLKRHQAVNPHQHTRALSIKKSLSQGGPEQQQVVWIALNRRAGNAQGGTGYKVPPLATSLEFQISTISDCTFRLRRSINQLSRFGTHSTRKR